MALTSNTRIAWSNKETKTRNLEWCFRPMLICLRIFGVDFKWNQQRSAVKQNLIRLICLFWLVITALTIYGLGNDLYDNTQKIVQKNNFRKVSYNIKESCLMVEIGGIYSTLVFFTWKHSQKLVESFKQIEIHSEIDKKTYQRLRTTIIIGVFLSILSVFNLIHATFKDNMPFLIDCTKECS